MAQQQWVEVKRGNRRGRNKNKKRNAPRTSAKPVGRTGGPPRTSAKPVVRTGPPRSRKPVVRTGPPRSRKPVVRTGPPRSRKPVVVRRSSGTKAPPRGTRRPNLSKYKPGRREGREIVFPDVVHSRTKSKAPLVYRGMSVNNIKNMQKGKGPIFTVQKPGGTANATKHIVDDAEDSPFLSFEAGGLGISAGKYAAKPVDSHNKPLDVEKRTGGFLKQAKSYSGASRRKHAHRKHIGYVGGISTSAGTRRIDVSDWNKADRYFKPGRYRTGQAKARAEKARLLATADKEVLVKPGDKGIGKGHMPFMAKVQRVDKDYYDRHLRHQTPTKALGFFKPKGGAAMYHKIQVSGPSNYQFNVPPELRRGSEDDEMSDIDSMDLEDFEEKEPKKSPSASPVDSSEEDSTEED